MSESENSEKFNENAIRYGRAKLLALFVILAIWFTVSFGCGILFRDQLDSMLKIGNAPFGFWMAQQGSIICFVLLLVVYAVWMNLLDAKFGFSEKGGDS